MEDGVRDEITGQRKKEDPHGFLNIIQPVSNRASAKSSVCCLCTFTSRWCTARSILKSSENSPKGDRQISVNDHGQVRINEFATKLPKVQNVTYNPGVVLKTHYRHIDIISKCVT